jgi:alpha-tubulin suppressor-like RCC1 family protein
MLTATTKLLRKPISLLTYSCLFCLVLTSTYGAPLKIAAGFDFSLYLDSNGNVWGVGNDTTSQLGNDSIHTEHYATPVQVLNLTGVQAVSAGDYHSLFLKSDGTVWAVGYNASGQLGDGTTMQRTTPVQVQGMTSVQAIAAGDEYSLFLKTDGTVWAVGYNRQGQLGDGTQTNRSLPVQVQGLTGVRAIAAATAGEHSLFLKGDGTVWAVGDNQVGQLGDGTTTSRTSPVQVQGITGIQAIAAGNAHSLFSKSDGTAWAAGYNTDGELGDGTTTIRTTPVQVLGLTDVQAVSAGEYHSLFLKADGTVWAVGANTIGELGDGTTTNRSIPVQVQGLTGGQAIAAGYHDTMILKVDGSVFGVGGNGEGEIGDGTTTTRLVAVLKFVVLQQLKLIVIEFVFVVEFVERQLLLRQRRCPKRLRVRSARGGRPAALRATESVLRLALRVLSPGVMDVPEGCAVWCSRMSLRRSTVSRLRCAPVP